ncbi:MAG: 16S rRNA (guanine(966)-N(2))-methyltransferase RsmD [Alphaproteobacteria bacterium]|nr:16S rRNA (guanine(966)-N(2))-methyltransferase RsmD [Alphaproteobacteria bacterium]HCP00014.1 16S rRNA (guanine(966)-N(2))-methyltransferase RsmD [Rhodospirillaceae bacterium]
MTAQAGRLRIIGGSHRGRRIQTPLGSDARPTGDRVREALFNILVNGLADAPALSGASVLDACAGSGALGIEALSRGAKHAIFFDIDRAAVRQIASNLDVLGLRDRADVQRMDVRRPSAGTPCTILFLDPPYDSDTAQIGPEALAHRGWLAPGSLCVIETRRGADLDCGAEFRPLDARTYGDTSLHFLSWLGQV